MLLRSTSSARQQRRRAGRWLAVSRHAAEAWRPTAARSNQTPSPADLDPHLAQGRGRDPVPRRICPDKSFVNVYGNRKTYPCGWQDSISKLGTLYRASLGRGLRHRRVQFSVEGKGVRSLSSVEVLLHESRRGF